MRDGRDGHTFVVINLDGKEVAWRIEDWCLKIKGNYPEKWDGHDHSEKSVRITNFIDRESPLLSGPAIPDVHDPIVAQAAAPDCLHVVLVASSE